MNAPKNAINWFEIPVSDFARAVTFYEQILATKLTPDTSFPDMQMAMLPYSEPGVGGCLIQYAPLKPHADGARIYLNGGNDLQAILDRVAAAGGQIAMPKMFIREDIGYIGAFVDSEGNTIGLHSMH